MKRVITICLVCVLTTAAWGVIVPPTISFDENGNGNVDGTPLQFGVDTPPIGHATLYYILPFTPSMTQGDIVVLESMILDVAAVAVPVVTSDVLRFIPVLGGTQCRVYVYSEIDGQPPYDLADTGIPDPLLSNNWPWNEVGLENGFNGVTYQPLTNDEPGWMPGGVTYIFTSDVPEPATICLLGLGALSLLRRKR